MNLENERISIIKFLQWNDKHGAYTDDNRDIEGIPRMTYKESVKYFFGVLHDDFYYAIADNIFELTYEEVIQYAKEDGFYDKTIQKLELLTRKDNPTEEFYRSLIS